MYIKNKRDSSSIKACSPLKLSTKLESFVLRNRLLFIYSPLWTRLTKLVNFELWQ